MPRSAHARKKKQNPRKRLSESRSSANVPSSRKAQDWEQSTYRFLATVLPDLRAEAKKGNTEAINLLWEVGLDATYSLNESDRKVLREIGLKKPSWPVVWVPRSPEWIRRTEVFIADIGVGSRGMALIQTMVKNPTGAKHVAFDLLGVMMAYRHAALVSDLVNELDPPATKRIPSEFTSVNLMLTDLLEARSAQAASLSEKINVPSKRIESIASLLAAGWSKLPPPSTDSHLLWRGAVCKLLVDVTNDQFEHERFGLRSLGESANVKRGGKRGVKELRYAIREGIMESIRRAVDRFFMNTASDRSDTTT